MILFSARVRDPQTLVFTWQKICSVHKTWEASKGHSELLEHHECFKSIYINFTVDLQYILQSFWQTVYEIRYKLGYFIISFHCVLCNKVVNFQANFIGKLWSLSRTKFTSFCSVCLVNITAGELKQSEKNRNQARFTCINDVYFWNVNYLRGIEGLHITDGWCRLHLVYSRNVNTKVQQHEIDMFCIFLLFLEWRMPWESFLSLIDLNVK